MIVFIYSFIMLGIQGPGGAGPPQPRPGYETNAEQLPIDGNIWVLITIGVIFGIYMIYRKNHITNRAS